jgi:hypothetical protein
LKGKDTNEQKYLEKIQTEEELGK